MDWDSYDLAVLRSTWDYMPRRAEFVAWARGIPHLYNPANVVEWNTDKRYLEELAAMGIPVIPTTFIAPTEMWIPTTSGGEYVIKPAIGAGSIDSGRYGPADTDHAVEHIGRLQREGRTVMVQPYLPGVDTLGETALLYFATEGQLKLSHAIRKGPMLQGPDVASDELYRAEEITPREPSAQEVALGEQVLAALPGGLLYARIDLIPGGDENPLLMEVELTEPSLFLGHSSGAADRFAAAILARLSARANQ